MSCEFSITIVEPLNFAAGTAIVRDNFDMNNVVLDFMNMQQGDEEGTNTSPMRFNAETGNLEWYWSEGDRWYSFELVGDAGAMLQDKVNGLRQQYVDVLYEQLSISNDLYRKDPWKNEGMKKHIEDLKNRLEKVGEHVR